MFTTAGFTFSATVAIASESLERISTEFLSDTTASEIIGYKRRHNNIGKKRLIKNFLMFRFICILTSIFILLVVL
jgi:hypothetical protein